MSLKASDLSCSFAARRRWLHADGGVLAVDRASLELVPGQTFGIVGESGSGKSTLARMLLGLLPPTAGLLEFEGHDTDSFTRAQWLRFRRSVQPVFQDPRSALNPKHSVETIIGEPLRNFGQRHRAQRRARAIVMLEHVHLTAEVLQRKPQELSGGQLQRVAIARALALDPDYLICDEPLSALDVSVQAGVVNLLLELQDAKNLAMLFISHDLDVVRHMSDTVAVMWRGQIVEQEDAGSIATDPTHPYTRQLLGLAARDEDEAGSDDAARESVPFQRSTPTRLLE
jgi:peptide/nickel transport system ATP-binding protein